MAHGFSRARECRGGIVPLSLSRDVGGPLARSVTDIAIVLDATVGIDSDNPITSRGAARRPASYLAALDRDGLRGARVGVLLPLFGEAQDDLRAGSVVRTAIQAMEQRGARAVPIVSGDIPTDADGVAIIRFEQARHRHPPALTPVCHNGGRPEKRDGTNSRN